MIASRVAANISDNIHGQCSVGATRVKSIPHHTMNRTIAAQMYTPASTLARRQTSCFIALPALPIWGARNRIPAVTVPITPRPPTRIPATPYPSRTSNAMVSQPIRTPSSDVQVSAPRRNPRLLSMFFLSAMPGSCAVCRAADPPTTRSRPCQQCGGTPGSCPAPPQLCSAYAGSPESSHPLQPRASPPRQARCARCSRRIPAATLRACRSRSSRGPRRSGAC